MTFVPPAPREQMCLILTNVLLKFKYGQFEAIGSTFQHGKSLEVYKSRLKKDSHMIFMCFLMITVSYHKTGYDFHFNTI